MKKLLSALLTLVLCIALLAAASAAGKSEGTFSAAAANDELAGRGSELSDTAEESCRVIISDPTMDAAATHPSGFDGEKLYINPSGKTLSYERYEPGTGSLTKNALLDLFETETELEGIVWEVYSAKEYPDRSFVLVISGTNASWTYRMDEEQ